MGPPDQRQARLGRTLWRIFIIGFAISLTGLAILFTPTLELATADLIEKLGLPIGLIANVAMISVYSLFVICGIGLIVMVLRSLFRTRHKT